MLNSMDTFTIVIFLAVTVVLAVAIIALAIWVAVLSNRMKKMIDVAYTDSTHNESSPSHTSSELTIPTGPGRVLNPPLAQSNNGYSQNGMRQQATTRRMAPQGYDSYGSSMRTTQQSGPMNMDEHEYGNGRGDSAFFDNYQDQEYSNQNGGFGRRKPTIPFGKAKEGPSRRFDSYTESALDSDYDPDSIDFSRVEGYKNFRR